CRWLYRRAICTTLCGRILTCDTEKGTFMIKIAIPKEIGQEKRVAITPQIVPELIQLGCEVLLEKNAGLSADFPDEQYQYKPSQDKSQEKLQVKQSQNVQIYPDARSLYEAADIILKVQAPDLTEITQFKKHAILTGLLAPTRNQKLALALREHGITSFAMEN